MSVLDDYKQMVREMMSAHIRRHSVAIWQEWPSGRVDIGSGVCVQIADHLFIATAAHNVEVIIEKGNITLFSTGSNTPLDIVDQHYGGYGADGTLDLGWLEIARASAAGNGLEGLPLNLC